jgi:hypothetical protein
MAFLFFGAMTQGKILVRIHSLPHFRHECATSRVEFGKMRKYPFILSLPKGGSFSPFMQWHHPSADVK